MSKASGNVATLNAFTNVRQFGARGNGTSDDTAALAAAITAAGANGTVALPFGTYLVAGTLTLSTGQTLIGIGGRPTILRGAAGTLIDASAAQTTLQNLYIDGEGGTYTNTSTDIAVAYTNGSNGYQTMRDVWIYDSAGPAVSFGAADAGQKSKFFSCIFQRTTATNPAVVLPTSAESVGGREFHECRGDGGWLLRFNSGINTRIIGGDTVNLDFSASDGVSLRAIVQGVRIATGGSALTVRGNDSVISGCVIAGPGAIAGTAARNQITGNVLTAGSTWTDTSTATGDNVNLIDYALYNLDAASPTTKWGADTVDPVLGNGTLSTRIVRRGRSLKIDIVLNIGSTTTFGTDSWFFALPAPFSTWTARSLATGTLRIFDGGSQWYNGTCYVNPGASKIYMVVTQGVTGLSPMTWASGDYLSLTIEYEIA